MTERARYWAGQLAAWERSGLTQAEYCRRGGIKAVNSAWWKRQLLGYRRGAKTGWVKRTRPARRRNRQRDERAKPYVKSPTRRRRSAESFDSSAGPGQPSRFSERLVGAGGPTMSSEGGKRRARSAKVGVSFMELPWPGPWAGPTYEVVLAGGRVIRIPSPFDPQTLSHLIGVVESC